MIQRLTTETSWNVGFPVPKRVLDRFHASWPSARLHAKMVQRVDPDSYEYPMDRPLLSSPQLYSLDIQIFHYADKLTEFPTLKKCIIRASGLKMLRFSGNSQGGSRQTDWESGPHNFQFQDGDVMPAIEQLRIPVHGYDLSDENCKQWKNCMDWSKLLRLDLDNYSPDNLMLALTGKVPNLKVLEFGLTKHRYANWKGETNLGVASRFLASINGLEELRVVEREVAVLPILWPEFLEKHGNTLHTLSITYLDFVHANPWEPSDFANLLEKSPKLESLVVNMALEQRVQHGPQSPETDEHSWIWVCISSCLRTKTQ